MVSIFVLGNTGCGKSTFINELMKNHNYIYNELSKYNGLPDEYEDKSLENFYRDPTLYGYKNEIFHMINAIKNICLLDNKYSNQHIIFDRSFLDIICFTETLHNLKLLSDEHYEVLNAYNEVTFNLFIKKVDILVYIYSDVSVLIDNIRKRNRIQEIEALEYNHFYEMLTEYNKVMVNLVDTIKYEYKVPTISLKNISKIDIKSQEYKDKLKFIDQMADEII